MTQETHQPTNLSSQRRKRVGYATSLGIVALLIALSLPSPDAEANGGIPIDVTITATFIGCSGETATYNLSAYAEPLSNGISFEWNQGVTPTSYHLANPNTATTSFVKRRKIVSVTAENAFVCGEDLIILGNPCTYS